MNNIRLGLSSLTIEPLMNGGHLDGIGVYTKQLLNHYSKESDLFVTPISYPYFSKKIPLSQLPNGCFWPVSFSTATLYSLVMRRPLLNKDIDLYHATDYRIPKLKCPVVASLHDAIPLQHPEWVGGKFRWAKNVIMRKAAGWADHVIAISHAAVPDIVNYFKVDEKKISVVHMGVDESWLTPLSEEKISELLKPYNLPKDYFLFVGTLQPRKNILRVIQAFKLLPQNIRRDKKLVIVGKAGWHVDEALISLQKLIDNKEALWLNNMNDELTLQAIYQKAHVFVFPSLYEGFGIPILEAFSKGVPVVTSNKHVLSEVSAKAALEVDVLSVEAISQAMKKLCEDDQLRQQCISRGFVRAKEKTWAACAKDTLAVYRKIL